LTERGVARPGLELLLVLGVSLGASAVYSVLSLLRKLSSAEGLAGSRTVINPSRAEQQWLDFLYQLAGNLLPLAAVGLAVYLLWLEKPGALARIGLNFERPLVDLGRGAALALAIGIPGIGLYFLARELGLAAEVVPSALPGYWWTVPMLVLAALKAGLVEEVIIVAFAFDRLRKFGLTTFAVVLVAALIRGSYHLYQGFGGFIGNFVMGLVFGYAYLRWRRVAPLVVAHTLMDAAVFIVGPSILAE
jgi:uncharacterized protein